MLKCASKIPHENRRIYYFELLKSQACCLDSGLLSIGKDMWLTLKQHYFSEVLTSYIAKHKKLVNRLILSFAYAFIFASSFSIFISNLGFWFLIALWLYKKYISDDTFNFAADKPYPLYLPILSFMAIHVFSWFISPDLWNSVCSSSNLLNMLIFFAVIDLHEYLPDIKKVSFVLLVTNIMILLLIPLVLLLKLTNNLYFCEYNDWAVNFKGFFSVHITYGTYLVMTVLLNLSVAYHCYSNNKAFQRTIYLLCALLCFSIALTSSRSAWLALTFSLLVFFSIIKRSKYVFVTLFIIVTAFITINYFNLNCGFVDNFKNRFQQAVSGNSNGRGHIWNVGCRIIMDNPILGVGGGGLKHYFPLYDKHSIYSSTTHLHNLLLNIWAELGVLGLIVFSWLLISMFKMSIDLYKNCKKPEARASALAVILMTYALFVIGFTEYNFCKVEISRLFWFVVGYAGFNYLNNVKASCEKNNTVLFNN